MCKFVTVEMRLLLETLMTNFALPRSVQIVNRHVTFDLIKRREKRLRARYRCTNSDRICDKKM